MKTTGSERAAEGTPTILRMLLTARHKLSIRNGLAALAICYAAAFHYASHADPPRLQNASVVPSVHFETSCAPAVRHLFDESIAMLHSYAFERALGGFDDIIAKDPACAMAEWGIALSVWGNPLSDRPTVVALDEGRAAVEKARGIRAKSERELQFIEAAGQLYDPPPSVEIHARLKAYAAAMQKVSAMYPSDIEATVFYAASLLAIHEPSDESRAELAQATEILESLFRRRPDHPGIAHYIMHSRDTPGRAFGALEVARRYASHAPDVSHALHMPSHIFTRLGLWRESIESNSKSVIAASRDDSLGEVLHALDYLEYAYLQIGLDSEAAKAVRQAEIIGAKLERRMNDGDDAGEAYALAAIAARYAVERGDWRAAAQLLVRQSNTVYADALTHFARAIGAIRANNDTVGANESVAALAGDRDALQRKGEGYWSSVVESERLGAVAWIAFGERDVERALVMMRASADIEDALDKPMLAPGFLLPARELLGELLVEAGRPEQAALEFRRSLSRAPNRYRGICGLARATERTGDASSASYGSALTENCGNGVGGRHELNRGKPKIMTHWQATSP
jgi:tetratricopeptide (TPR) repeat protein